jgi:hypothetical protein
VFFSQPESTPTAPTPTTATNSVLALLRFGGSREQCPLCVAAALTTSRRVRAHVAAWTSQARVGRLGPARLHRVNGLHRNGLNAAGIRRAGNIARHGLLGRETMRELNERRSSTAHLLQALLFFLFTLAPLKAAMMTSSTRGSEDRQIEKAPLQHVSAPPQLGTPWPLLHQSCAASQLPRFCERRPHSACFGHAQPPPACAEAQPDGAQPRTAGEECCQRQDLQEPRGPLSLPGSREERPSPLSPLSQATKQAQMQDVSN